jgi:hypothetical protein
MSIYDYVYERRLERERISFEAEVAELASPLKKRLAYTIGKLKEAAREERLKGGKGVHYFVSELLNVLWDIFQEVSQMDTKYRQAVLGEIAHTLSYELNLAIGLLIKKEAYGYSGLLETVKRLLEDNWEEEREFQRWREERRRQKEEEERRREEEERRRREEEERRKKEKEEERRRALREALLKGEVPAIKNRMRGWYLREDEKGGDLVLEVPQWLVPHAIGKGGQTIKALQEIVGRKIRVVGVDEPPPSKIDVEFPWR